MRRLTTIWRAIKESLKTRGRYLAWALWPRYAEAALLATLDHGVRKGLAVAESRRGDAALSTVKVEPHSVLVLTYAQERVDPMDLQTCAGRIRAWLKPHNLESVMVMVTCEGAAALQSVTMKDMRVHGWVRMQVLKGGNKG